MVEQSDNSNHFKTKIRTLKTLNDYIIGHIILLTGSSLCNSGKMLQFYRMAGHAMFSRLNELILFREKD